MRILWLWRFEFRWLLFLHAVFLVLRSRAKTGWYQGKSKVLPVDGRLAQSYEMTEKSESFFKMRIWDYINQTDSLYACLLIPTRGSTNSCLNSFGSLTYVRCSLSPPVIRHASSFSIPSMFLPSVCLGAESHNLPQTTSLFDRFLLFIIC